MRVEASKKQMVYLNHVKLFDVLLQAEKAVIAPLLNEVDFVSKERGEMLIKGPEWALNGREPAKETIQLAGAIGGE